MFLTLLHASVVVACESGNYPASKTNMSYPGFIYYYLLLLYMWSVSTTATPTKHTTHCGYDIKHQRGHKKKAHRGKKWQQKQSLFPHRSRPRTWIGSRKEDNVYFIKAHAVLQFHSNCCKNSVQYREFWVTWNHLFWCTFIIVGENDHCVYTYIYTRAEKNNCCLLINAWLLPVIDTVLVVDVQ